MWISMAVTGMALGAVIHPPTTHPPQRRSGMLSGAGRGGQDSGGGILLAEDRTTRGSYACVLVVSTRGGWLRLTVKNGHGCSLVGRALRCRR